MGATGKQKTIKVQFVSEKGKFAFIKATKTNDATIDVWTKPDFPPEVRETRRRMTRYYKEAKTRAISKDDQRL